MISGREVHTKIKEKIRELESEDSRVNSEITDYEHQISRLVQEREESYIRLATTYLPELTAQEIKKTLVEVREEVDGIFREKQKRRTQLESLIKQKNTTREQLEVKLDDVNQRLTKTSEDRRTLEELTNIKLSQNEEYHSLLQKEAFFNGLLEESKKEVETNKEEAAKKLPLMENNPFFKYLLAKDFNPTNPSRGLVGSLDSWVAKLINYSEMHADYQTLTDMIEGKNPLRDKRLEALTKTVVALHGIETDVKKSTTLTQVYADEQKLEQERKELISTIKGVDSQTESYNAEMKSSENSKDEYHQKAIQKLKEFLKGETITSLKEQAHKNNSVEDDQQVSQIEQTDQEIRRLKDQVKKARAQKDSIDSKISDIKKIESQYTSGDYEGDRSIFPSEFEITEVLNDYIRGTKRREEVWTTIQSNHRKKPAPTPTYQTTHHNNTSYHHSPSISIGRHSSGSGFGGGHYSKGSGF